jgi:phage-related baseplate assembly protein
MKLTTAQAAFFTRFALNQTANAIITNLTQQGLQITDEVLNQIDLLVAGADVTILRDAVAAEFTKRVEFKTLAKVDKYLNTPDAVSVMTAASEVGIAVQAELELLIKELFNIDEAE